jgi:O-antigen ligase
MLATHLRSIKYRPKRVGLLGLAVFALGGLAIVLGGAGYVANVLGRDSSFSGRTIIWAALIPTVSNPLFGTGFDSFWDSPNVLLFQRTLESMRWYHPERLNEAHNGYLDVYLNLGWVGLCIILGILTTGYLRACKAFRHDRELGSLMLVYIVTGMIYSITEAGFRTMSASWMFILFAVVSASGINAGLFAEETTNQRLRPSTEASILSISEYSLR